MKALRVGPLRVVILWPDGRHPRRGIGCEIATCWAVRHRHSDHGYRRDGCRCPSTVAAYEADKAIHREATRRYRAGLEPEPRRRRGPRPQREVETCVAPRHRHSYQGYVQDGCRCPSTVKAYDRRCETQRAACRAFRQRHAPDLDINLRRADRLDAEAIAQGYPIARVDIHTRALAVRMMRTAEPALTDRKVAERLTVCGQGRWITRGTGERVYQPVSMRQVQRIQAALDWKARPRASRSGQGLARPVSTE